MTSALHKKLVLLLTCVVLMQSCQRSSNSFTEEEANHVILGDWVTGDGSARIEIDASSKARCFNVPIMAHVVAGVSTRFTGEAQWTVIGSLSDKTHSWDVLLTPRTSGIAAVRLHIDKFSNTKVILIDHFDPDASPIKYLRKGIKGVGQ